MPTVGEIFEQHRALLGSVPLVSAPSVCRFCLGPVQAGYAQCYGCFALFIEGSADPTRPGRLLVPPGELGNRVVPMTTVLNPSPWYTVLATYKRGQLANHGPIIGALAYMYITTHAERIAHLLGGPPQCITVVPSKRGYAYGDQPLVRALSIVPPLREQLVSTLTYVPGSTWARRRYHPGAFRPGPVPVDGQRVLLLEDAWVTGATAVSAAGALEREGAAAVALLPVARVINADWLADAGHPYRVAMSAPYDLAHWPRQGWVRLL